MITCSKQLETTAWSACNYLIDFKPIKAFYLSLSVSICYQLSRQSNSNPDFDVMGIKKSFGFSPKIRSGSINNAKLETLQGSF